MPHPIALGEGAAPVIGRDLASGALRPAASPARATVRVDRCICRDRLFADLLPEARVQGWDLAALMAATGCGAQCGLSQLAPRFAWTDASAATGSSPICFRRPASRAGTSPH